uniref:Galectin n=1 Tax=Scleropages formosus TaxID=113540 RepID=A0A8C9R111_SCLFO
MHQDLTARSWIFTFHLIASAVPVDLPWCHVILHVSLLYILQCAHLHFALPLPSFSVNIGHGEDNIALHFNPRFNYQGDNNVIVFNSRHGGSWSEERRENHFPFEQGEEFKVTISFNNEEFRVKLPDGNMLYFPNRFGDDKYMYIQVEGDARVTGFKLK